MNFNIQEMALKPAQLRAIFAKSKAMREWIKAGAVASGKRLTPKTMNLLSKGYTFIPKKDAMLSQKTASFITRTLGKTRGNVALVEKVKKLIPRLKQGNVWITPAEGSAMRDGTMAAMSSNPDGALKFTKYLMKSAGMI